MHAKYPRTPHLPWSGKKTDDDKVLKSIDHFIEKEIIISIKMDGENTTLYSDGLHARSLDSNNHPSRNWIKNKHASISHLIPSGYRICGENLFAKHTIYYNNLEDLFLVFSVWFENTCLSWEQTKEFTDKLGLKLVPVYNIEIFDEKKLKNLDLKTFNNDPCEGYVIRNSNSFTDFSTNVAKCVYSHFNINTDHWTKSKIIQNKIR